jgi:hypothetical protein
MTPALSIIKPYEVLPANVIDTNIPLETAWNNSTHYAVGVIVYHADAIWQAISANHNSEPTATNPNWVNIGPPNRMACFDIQYGTEQIRISETKTTGAGDIEYTIEGLSRINSMAFFGLKASRIEITATDGGSYSYSTSYDLKRNTPLNGRYWNYFHGPRSREDVHIFADLNIPPNATIDIVISNNDIETQVASIVLGLANKFGTVSDGAGGTAVSIDSRSIFKLDGLLVTNIPRATNSSATYHLMLWNYEAMAFLRAARDVDGIAAVFSVEGSPELAAYGLMQNCQLIPLTGGISSVNFGVRSL